VQTGVDNWQVKINTAVIPEPTSLFLALLATTGVLGMRNLPSRQNL